MIGFVFCIRLTYAWCQIPGFLSLGFFHVRIALEWKNFVKMLGEYYPDAKRVRIEVDGVAMEYPAEDYYKHHKLEEATDKLAKQLKEAPLSPSPVRKKISTPTSPPKQITKSRDNTKQKTVLNKEVVINTQRLEQEFRPKSETKPQLPKPPPPPKEARRELTAVEESAKLIKNVKIDKDDASNPVKSVGIKHSEPVKSVDSSQAITKEIVRPTPNLDKPFEHKFFGSQLLVGKRMIIGNLPRKLHTLEIIGKQLLIDTVPHPINEGELENLKRIIRENRA